MIVSAKQGPHGVLLVITDTNILGKTFEEGKLQLDLSKQFYQGDEMGKEEVILLLRSARDIQFTGKESVALGIEKDLVNPEHILYVQGVPHAEVVIGS